MSTLSIRRAACLAVALVMAAAAAPPAAPPAAAPPAPDLIPADGRPGDPRADELLPSLDEAVRPAESERDTLVELIGGLRRAQWAALHALRSDWEKKDEPADPAARKQAVLAALAREREQFLAEGRDGLDRDRRERFDAWAEAVDLAPAELGWARTGRPVRGPAVGESAPVFVVYGMAEQKVTLPALSGRPVVLEFGSYTSPLFRRDVAAVNALREEFAKEDIIWLLVYTAEAYPKDGRRSERNLDEGITIAQHLSMRQRFKWAELTQEILDPELVMVLDDIDNTMATDYAGHPHGGYVLDAEGTVVSRQIIFDVVETRRALRAALAAD